MRLLAVCAIAALLPVLLCFLSVGMLFLAEGKKTMLLPTLFTSLVLAELLIVLAVFPALYPFLLSGIYFFTLLQHRGDNNHRKLGLPEPVHLGVSGCAMERIQNTPPFW